jgi:hypothetical protein
MQAANAQVSNYTFDNSQFKVCPKANVDHLRA